MKKFAFILTAFSLMLFSFTACNDSSSSSLTVSGTIQNAGSMQVFLEKTGIVPNTPNTVVAKTEADENGNFSITVDQPLAEGLYRIRIGQQSINLIFDGTERDVKVTGDLQQLNNFQYTVEGSPSSLNFLQTVQGYRQKQPNVQDIEKLVETSENPLVGAYIATLAFGNKPQFANIHEKAAKRIEAAYPGSTYASDYNSFISSLKQLAMNTGGGANGLIPEAQRQPAPDIRLPGPDGKTYALSDLKGKVVLLDFWASWCMPCRRENPNVVKVYQAYKDKGFTVFSVSLDGVDGRTASRFNNDPKKIAELKAQGKQRWIEAIQKDGLEWPYHVSDLKKWDCEPARQYGVTGIPRAFIIDKEGRIAATQVRGAEAIEAAIKELL
ncbi:MAG: AhpC/TSA family protein [Bacteroidetes bacterium]|nr:MAG: AhpC/TSA family protein [Bacteroidota bacterium]